MNAELENIIEKVKELFLRYGIKSVTMDDIAAELGISKKTLYQYVPTKDELVDLVVNMEAKRREHMFTNIMESKQNAIDDLIEINNQVNKIVEEYSPTHEYDLRKYYPAIHRKLVEYKRNKLYESMLQNLIKGKAQGYYRQDLNEEIIAKLYVSRVENVLENDLFGQNECMSPLFINEVMAYHIRGISNESGIEYYEQQMNQNKKQ